MELCRRRARLWVHLSAAALVLASMASPAAASVVGTSELLAQAPAAQQSRAQLNAFLARDAVQKQLVQWGVDPQQAQARIARLSDREAQSLAQRMQDMPAGGDLLGAAVFVFLVLLATDILGYTDVFPFVKKTVQ